MSKEKVLKRLKYILNSYTDKELEEIDLWIDNANTVDVIAVDSNSISLITDENRLKIDGRQW